MLKISEIRKERGIAQKDLAEYLNISPGNLCEWEKGRIEPSIDFLNKIADYFNVSIDYLVGRENDFGNIVISGSEKKETLSLKEQRLLKAFNKLSDLEKEKLIEDAEFYAKRYAINPENRNK